MPAVSITRRPARRLPFLPFFDRAGEDFEAPMRRLFDSMFTPDFGVEPVGMLPAVEIAETPEEFTCTLELPGLKEKDVTVSFEKGVLMIKGEKKDEREVGGKDKKYHLWERSYGAFERSFTFPGKVDDAKIAAEMTDGVLAIKLPKAAEEKAQSRKIEIATK